MYGLSCSHVVPIRQPRSNQVVAVILPLEIQVGGWRILILDQHEDVLLDLEHVLETAGFDTTLAWHVDAFPRFVAERDFDLIIVGHRPPEIDAAEVLRTLGPMRAQMIVLKGRSRHPFEDEYFYRLGAHAVLNNWNSDIAGCIRTTLAKTNGTVYAS